MIFPILLIVVLFIGVVLLGREWFKSQDEIKELASDRQRLQTSQKRAKTDADHWWETCLVISKERDEANENYRSLRNSTTATIADLETNVNRLTAELFRANETIKSRTSCQDFWKAEHDKLSKEVDERNEVIDDLHVRMNLIRDARDELLKERDAKIDELTQELDTVKAERDAWHRMATTEGITREANAEELDSAKVEIEALRHELATAREFGDQLITIREKLRDALAAKRPNWKKLVEGLL